VFHVSLLDTYRSDGRYQPPPPPLEVDGALEYEVDRILAHRTIKASRRSQLEFLVAWQNYGPEHNSWEPERKLNNAKESIANYWRRTGQTGPQLVGGPQRVCQQGSAVQSECLANVLLRHGSLRVSLVLNVTEPSNRINVDVDT
jgi:hypothetical protein